MIKTHSAVNNTMTACIGIEWIQWNVTDTRSLILRESGLLRDVRWVHTLYFCYIMAFWYRIKLRKLKTLAGQIFAVCIRTCYQYFPICIPIENKVNWFWSQRHFLSIDRIPGISRIYSTLFSVLLLPSTTKHRLYFRTDAITSDTVKPTKANYIANCFETAQRGKQRGLVYRSSTILNRSRCFFHFSLHSTSYFYR